MDGRKTTSIRRWLLFLNALFFYVRFTTTHFNLSFTTITITATIIITSINYYYLIFNSYYLLYYTYYIHIRTRYTFNIHIIHIYSIHLFFSVKHVSHSSPIYNLIVNNNIYTQLWFFKIVALSYNLSLIIHIVVNWYACLL